MKIKKDDTVVIITGTDKGKTGKVLKAFPRINMVIVDGINIHKRHRRPTRQDQKGQIVELPHPIHVSNLRKAGEETPKKSRAKKTTPAA